MMTLTLRAFVRWCPVRLRPGRRRPKAAARFDLCALDDRALADIGLERLPHDRDRVREIPR